MRISARVVDDIRRRLSETDWAVLSMLDRVDVASARQLRRLVWPDDTQARTARRRLGQLTESRVISRLDRRVGGVRAGSDGYVYRLDVAGRRLLGHTPGRRPHTPGRTFMDHALAVTEIYVLTVEISRTDVVEISEFQTEPSCWRHWGSGVLKPDAYLATVTPEFEDHWFIEVDRATESSTTIARKVTVYEQYHRTGIEQAKVGVFPRVLWVVPNDRRKAQIVETLARRRPEDWHLHRVVLDDELSNLFKP